MEFKPKKNLLLLRPDTVDVVYKSLNLGKPGEMEDAIRALREWVYKQPHFKRKDFTDNFLRSAIITARGSTEGTKQKLDKICTLRTLLSDNFRAFDVKKDFENVFNIMRPIVLPQLTKDHYRVLTVKPYGAMESSQISDALKYTVVVSDYLRQCDIVNSFIGIIDLSLVNIIDVVTKLNLMDLRRAITVYFEGHGVRIKGIYFVTTSKLIDALISLLKQILNQKIIQRIRVFNSWDEVHDIIGKDIIPVDFGGHEKSEHEIHDEWIEELSSDDFKKYLRDINSTGTDESCRPSHKFNEEYAGMPGTFRLLSID